MARFESLYGNRILPFRLDAVPMMREAPRPGRSQYFIEPVERRIASTVYGLPGDFFLTGGLPIETGVRKALAQRIVAYGAVTLHKDSIEFIGAAPNPGVASWQGEQIPGSLMLSREVLRLRTTRSLDRLADAVISCDGYLWRLGLRGFDINRRRFENLLRHRDSGEAAFIRVQEALDRESLLVDPSEDIVFRALMHDGAEQSARNWFNTFSGSILDEIAAWQRWRLLAAPALPSYEAGDVERLLHSLGLIHIDRAEIEALNTGADMPQLTAKLIGWSLICRGRDTAGELRAFLEKPAEAFAWSSETLEFVREQARKAQQIIESH